MPDKPGKHTNLTASPTEAETAARARLAWLNTDGAFRLALALFALVLVVYGGITLANALIPGKSIKDYELWYDTGQHVLRGEPIYPVKKRKFPFMYPPTAALLLAPISALGKTGVVVTLVLMNGAAWTASILLSVRLATGSWRRQHLLVYVIPSLIIGVYAWSNFHLGQPSLLLLALLLGAFVALQHKQELLAGGLIALAASIKAFPFIAIVYLLYRRYWIAAASLLAGLVFLLLLLPVPFRGFQQAQFDVKRWTQGMLKYDEKGVAQRPGRSNSWKNQSIFGVANRLLRRVDADDQVKAHTPLYANVAALDFRTVNGIIAGAGLVLGLVYIRVMPRRNRRTTETDAIEFALFILLMLMFTPLAFGYLFACLLFPFTVVVARLLDGPSGRLFVGALISLLLLVATIPLQRTAQTYGNTFLATLTLFIALAIELGHAKRVEPARARAEGSASVFRAEGGPAPTQR